MDKVNRIFKPQASDLGLETHLSGKSYKQSRGPNVFEIVPYVLIDNALKCTLKGLDVEVTGNDLDKMVELRVISYGPELLHDEKTRIFEKGFRGKGAVASGKSGSGIGLHLANRIVKLFKGSITVEQAVSERRGGLLLTEFVVRLPVL